MRALRILMLTTFYPPYSFGGDGVTVQRLARALISRGHDVTVVHDEDAFFSLGGSSNVSKDNVGSDGVEVIGLRSRFGVLSNLLVHQTGRAVLHSKTLRQIFSSRRPDIVWHNNVSLMGAPGIFDFDAPIKVYEAHEHWLICPTHVLWRYDQKPCESRRCIRCVLAHRRPLQLWRATKMMERKLENMDLVIAKSRFSRDKHYAFGLKKKMAVLPLFLPSLSKSNQHTTDSKRPTSVHPRPFFLFVGRLEKIKGIQDVLPAIQRYGKADLLIAGEGDYAKKLQTMTAGQTNVHFLGRLDPSKLSAYYKEAIATLVPSLCYETFGAILVESFRMGTPVIARRLGPFPEIVETAGAGMLFDTEDELVEALSQLHRDKGLRNKLSQAALEGFDINWHEDRIINAYGTELAKAARRKELPDLARIIEASMCLP